MHRALSISTTATRASRHPQGGTSSAGVGQAVAHGIVSHIMQAITPTSSTGVPAANPADAGNLLMACTGHTSAHAPQRVQAATNAASGNAPGGRWYLDCDTFWSTAPTTSRRARVRPCEKNARRSSGLGESVTRQICRATHAKIRGPLLAERPSVQESRLLTPGRRAPYAASPAAAVWTHPSQYRPRAPQSHQ